MKQIKELRNKRGLSQGQLARLVGVTPSAISALERGKIREPRWSLVMAIARELRVGARTLFAGREETIPPIAVKSAEFVISYMDEVVAELKAGEAKAAEHPAPDATGVG